MRTRINQRMARLALLATLATSTTITLAATVVFESGSVIPVRLDQNLSSDHSRSGDTFWVTVRSGYMGLPIGTRVQGVVRRAIVKTKDKPGVLLLEFNRIVLPNGRRTTIDGTPVGLDSKSVSTGKNGRLVAQSGVKNKRLTYVGYGAGAGALVALLGGSNRVVETTAIGAALGYLAGALEKGGQKQKNNVLLAKGTSLGVLLQTTSTVRK